MARIKTYVKDTVITDGDKLLGTDAANNNRTVNIEVGSLKTYMEDNADFNATTTTFSQNTAASVWVIPHNLDKFPSVTVVDSANDVIIGDINYDSSDSLTISFSSETSGKAYLN